MVKSKRAAHGAIVGPDRTRHWALIFLTGAVALSLEVLASRIMTPYFGVSLYIWSGILSIILVFLALMVIVTGSPARSLYPDTGDVHEFLVRRPELRGARDRARAVGRPVAG